MRGHTALLAALALVAVVGCSSGRLPSDLVDSDDGEGARMIEAPECDDESGCSQDFLLDGVRHSVSCGAVRSEVVTDDVLASGLLWGQQREVRLVEGVDPRILVALELDAGQCDEGDVVLSPWSMAFTGNGARGDLKEAICAVAVEEHLDRNGCR